MHVGAQPDAFLLTLQEQQNMTYSEALFSYVIEALLCRIYESDYKEFLWLKNLQKLMPEYIRQGKESCFELYYVESDKYIAPGKIVPGVPWSDIFADKLQQDLLEVDWENGLSWRTKSRQSISYTTGETTTVWSICATYHQMNIPVTIKLIPLCDKNSIPQKQTLSLISRTGYKLTVYTYSAENRLADSFFEIITKLELISDMASYDTMNRILKTESVSGRHIMEMLEEKTREQPKLLREKRMDQLAGYRNYSYMKKRWEQYRKRHAIEEENWEEVIDRLLRFGKPVWRALCRHEIFFDDWMPELSRFLG